MQRHGFRIVSCESPETMRKLCLSTKFPHYEIRWNYGIFCRALHAIRFAIQTLLWSLEVVILDKSIPRHHPVVFCFLYFNSLTFFSSHFERQSPEAFLKILENFHLSKQLSWKYYHKHFPRVFSKTVSRALFRRTLRLTPQIILLSIANLAFKLTLCFQKFLKSLLCLALIKRISLQFSSVTRYLPKLSSRFNC